MKVTSVAEMREIDRRTFADYGIPTAILMENAGEAAYQVIRRESATTAKRYALVCGGGNNGGDGFVVARKLHANGAAVNVLLLAKKESYRDAARQNLEILCRLPVEIREVATADEIKNALAQSDVIIDAIFGTGLTRTVEGIYQEAISLINGYGGKVFALDIASGINGDTGQEMGIAVQADITVTFGLPKVGNLLYPGYGRGGKLYVTYLSIPPSLYNADSLKIELPLPVELPERRADASKMDYGPIMVIAGAASYFWAPYASAYSFLKAGGGYVFLACPKSLAPVVAKRGKEVVFLPQLETQTGSISMANRDHLLELTKRVKMVIIGPGLSLNEETQRLVRNLVRDIDKPLLIDGDGITAVAEDTGSLLARKAPTILTPHTGEMGRLTGKRREEIDGDRIAVLMETGKSLNATIVLKGAHSLIGHADQRVYFNTSGTTSGHAGMATAGSGDVLNGTIAAMFCLGLPLDEAVRTGVFIHGLAGDLAAQKRGADGMTAQDILNALPVAVRHYRANLPEIRENYCESVFEV